MRLVLILVAIVGSTAPGVVGQLGPLPADPLVSEAVRGVHAELSLGFLIDPDLLVGRIPEGLRPIRAGSLGLPESAVRASAADFVASTFVLLVADTIEVYGSTSVRSTRSPASMAYWWVLVEDAPPVDEERALGPTQAVQLGIWYGDPTFRLPYVAAGVAVGAAEIGATRQGEEWRFSFTMPDADISGHCRLVGEIAPLDYTLPAYSTVWHAGPRPLLFSVFTYHGQRLQECEILEIDASGSGILASAIRTSAALIPILANVQDGWEANGAIYQHRRR